jgi:hypothetical protein
MPAKSVRLSNAQKKKQLAKQTYAFINAAFNIAMVGNLVTIPSCNG